MLLTADIDGMDYECQIVQHEPLTAGRIWAAT